MNQTDICDTKQFLVFSRGMDIELALVYNVHNTEEDIFEERQRTVRI